VVDDGRIGGRGGCHRQSIGEIAAQKAIYETQFIQILRRTSADGPLSGSEISVAGS